MDGWAAYRDGVLGPRFTAMVIRGPNRRRDFHDDPSDEIFYMLKGAMTLEYFEPQGQRQNVIIPEGGLMLVPAHTPHAPHRAADTWGLVVEIKRGTKDVESLIWYCDNCNAELHRVTMAALDIEAGLKAAILGFDHDEELRTCGRCGHVQPEQAPLPEPPVAATVP